MIDMNTLNVTTFKAVVGTVTAAVLMLMVTTAVLFFGFTPNEVQLKVLYTVATIAIAMMGLSVAQFIGKRATDINYQAVKRTGMIAQLPQVPQVPTYTVRPQNVRGARRPAPQSRDIPGDGD